ncbi:MAG: hypothetical protein AB7K09_21240 [Planctomycetota bacterium]
MLHRPFILLIVLAVASWFAPVSLAHADSDPPEVAAYIALPKALYVWRLKTENHYIERLAAFCKRHGFRRVYLAIGSCQWDHEPHYANGRLPNEDQLAMAVAALKVVGTEVHGMYVLNDDANDLQKPERVADIVTATHNYNTRHAAAPIVGLHGDQEPSDPAQYAAYMRMNRLAAERRDELRAKLQLGVTLKPVWLRQPWPGEDGKTPRPFAQHVLDVVDEASLMDYSDQPATVLQLGAQALQAATAANKPMALALETGTKGAAPEETWGQEILRDGPLPFFRALASFDVAFRKSGKAYGGLVVHDYFQYYQLLYGTDPIAHTMIPSTVFGSSPADAIAADTAAPECLRGFVGKLGVRVARVEAEFVVVEVVKVRREERESAASKARDAEGAFIALHPGGNGDDAGVHARWLQSLSVGDDETIDLTVNADGRSEVRTLTSSQRRAADRGK